MSTDEIPPDVRGFIRAHVPSVGHMEALALAIEQERVWTGPEVAKRLYVEEGQAVSILKDLTVTGILAWVAEEGGWRRSRTDTELAELAERTTRMYRQRLVVMTNLIHARKDPGQQFADAFRFRKG